VTGEGLLSIPEWDWRFETENSRNVSLAEVCVSLNQLIDAHVNLFRFGLFGLWQRDGQNAVFVLRFHLVRRDWRGQCEGALEFSVEAFLPVDFDAIFHFLGLAFAGNDERAIL
jgi:hypothetical protein